LEREVELRDKLTQWQSGFDIEEGPTFCVGYLHDYEDDSTRAWIAMHHLIVDSVSWRIIVRDMQILYNGGNSGRKGSSYRQWAQTIEHYSFSETEKTYWKHLVEEASLVDWKKVPVSNGAIRTSFTLLMGQTKCLLRDCHRAYDTRIHELLLTALGYVLPEITQRQINYITLEAHGRDNIDPDLSITSTVGWYTTMYPLHLKSPTIGELVFLASKRALEMFQITGSDMALYSAIVQSLFLGSVLIILVNSIRAHQQQASGSWKME